MTEAIESPIARVDAATATDRDGELPGHVTRIPGGKWVAWRTMAVRAPGFPARLVEGMAAPRTAAAIDAALATNPSIDRAVTATLKETLDQELGGVRDAAVAVARDAHFREALVWQNRKVLHAAIDPFLQKPHTGNQNERARTSIIARYLQRYCVKNDSIGFFGPVGWGQLVDGGPIADVVPGADLVSSRGVALETWAIDAVAEALSRTHDLRPWIAPRLLPFFALEGEILHVPFTGPIPLPREQAKLLALCDGERTARQIAAMAVADPELAVSTEAEAFQLLEQALALGVIAWDLDLPLSGEPERLLRGKLELVDDPEVRRSVIEPLDALIEAKHRVAAAAGDWSRLDAAFQHLEERFSAITGGAASRREGETYASRTILYEDCRRDLAVSVGPGFLGHVGPALSLVLDSARWVSWQVAQRYAQELDRIYDDAVAETGAPQVELTRIFNRFEQEYMVPKERPIIAAVERDVQARWMSLLDLDLTAREERRRSDQLARGVREAFTCPGMGWPGGYVNPDVMVAARGLDALNRGEFTTVLGEVHFYNTLRGQLWVSQHPDPATLARQMQLDHPGPRALPLEPKSVTSHRLSAPLAAPDTRWLHLSREPARGDGAGVIPIGQVVVERGEGGLRLRTRDGREVFGMMELLGALLEVETSAGMVFISNAPHVPRVVIDDLVIARERWNFAAGDVDLARKEGMLATFVEGRRFAARNALPRFVFVRLPNEVKPVFVDLESPIYVDNLARLVRKLIEVSGRDAPISVTEMLPACDETWLVDAAGERYTAELRIVALEPRGAVRS